MTSSLAEDPAGGSAVGPLGAEWGVGVPAASRIKTSAR